MMLPTAEERAQARRYRTGRRARGWTQQRLADELGVSRPFVSQWERATRPIPPETRKRLDAILFGIDVAKTAPGAYAPSIRSLNRRKLQEAKGRIAVAAMRVPCRHGCGLVTTPGAEANHAKACSAGPVDD